MNKNDSSVLSTLAPAKKAKKSSNFAIYDALKAAQTSRPIPTHTLQSTKGIHSNAARWNEILMPKAFVMKKKRKKKLTTFKKKILMERLTVSIKKRVDSLIPNVSVVSEAPDSEVTSVYIFNFVNDVDLDDEAELIEVVSDLKELLKCIGDIVSTRIMLSPDNFLAHAEVTFGDLTTAQNAVSVVEGLVCGGQQLHASLTYSPYDNSKPLKAMPVQEVETSELASPSAVLTLFNMVSGDNIADEEETQEVLNDVQELCAVFGDVQRVWIEQRDLIQSFTSTVPNPASTHSHGETIASNLPWAVIHYSSIQECIASSHLLSTQVVAGCSLIAQFYDVNAHQYKVFQDRHIIHEGIENNQYALRLVGFVSTEELEGEEECAEVLENINAMLGSEIHTSIRFVSCSPRSDAQSSAVDVLIFVSNLQNCVFLFDRVRNQIVGGEKVRADILHIASTTAESLLSTTTSDETLSYNSPGCSCLLLRSDGSILAEVRRLCDIDGSAALVVQHYFTTDDLEAECESDLVEMKKDLLRLARSDTRKQNSSTNNQQTDSYVQSVRIVREQDSCDSSADMINTGTSESTFSCVEYVACVEFTLPAQAEDAMLHLDERIIGGAELRAARDSPDASYCTRKIVAELIVSPEEECSHAALTPTNIGDETIHTTERAELLCLYSVEYTTAEGSNSALLSTRPAGEDGLGDLSGAATSQGKGIVSKYIEAQALPKLPVHSMPRLPIPCADDATNAAAKELLKLISTFQARLKEKNPLKAKQKLRFVAGLKQCINSVKAGNVKLLLLAPNTEANEVLDDKIDLLINEAQQRAVPVCYCLSKRLLGKAAQLSMKQSAVAVLDPDGAYEYYKIVIKYVCPDR